MINRTRLAAALLLFFMLLPRGAAAQNKLTVIVYDVHAHKFVHGVKVGVWPLDAHNGQMAYLPSGPNPVSTEKQIVTVFGKSYIKLERDATTDSNGRAVFEVDEMLQVVDRVNMELAESPRKLITKHYEVGINILTKGKYCTYAGQSLHQIMETGVVGEITNPPSSCKTDVKTEDFHAAPGEIIMFVTHAM